jgi:saccharopine dehydrogenase (NADP+, L-glutamate forming)
VANYLNLPIESQILEQLKWLGLFSKRRINLTQATPAFVLEQLLREKWSQNPKYRDKVVIHHELDYTWEGDRYTRKSTTQVLATDEKLSGMAKAVGWPMGIILKKLALDQLPENIGIDVCSQAEVYLPVLEELKNLGIIFTELDEKN